MTQKSLCKMFVILAFILSGSVALAWGSLTGVNTHSYINEQAYEILKKDPALVDFPFPSLEDIQANEGVYHSGTDDGWWTGPGPDSEGKSFYSAHYYNPRTKKGEAPNVVGNFYAALALGILDQDKSVAKNSAWGGHFLADMSVVYHINGMPIADLKSDYKIQTSVNPDAYFPGVTLSGPRSKLSYHSTFVHGENFKDEADYFLAASAPSTKAYLDWFDPWYWNGATHSNYGSSHIEWETYHVSHDVDLAKMNYNTDWINAAPSFLNPIGDQATKATEFTVKAAETTLANFDAWVDIDTKAALSEAVANVATLWRASFSALRIFPLVEPDAANPSPTAGRFAVRAIAMNGADETAKNVQARLHIISGGQFAVIEPIKNLGDLSNATMEKPIVSEKWVIETEDIRLVKVRMDMIGGFSETPDLQYTKFEGLLEQPMNIVQFEGQYTGDVAGKVDFILNDKSFSGTMDGPNGVSIPLMGNLHPDGGLSIRFVGMINALETGTETTLSGTFTGKVQDQSSSGSWQGSYSYWDEEAKKNITRTLSGDWWADQKDIPHP